MNIKAMMGAEMMTDCPMVREALRHSPARIATYSKPEDSDPRGAHHAKHLGEHQVAQSKFLAEARPLYLGGGFAGHGRSMMPQRI
jgi:hypothetical protein